MCRIPYLESMDKYGTDKPDLRIDLVLQDATDVMADCGFGPFEGQTVKAVVVDGFTATRKVIDGICAEVEVQTANKAYWFKLDENGELVGGICKVLTGAARRQSIAALGLKPGDFVGSDRRQETGRAENSRRSPQTAWRCEREAYEERLLRVLLDRRFPDV